MKKKINYLNKTLIKFYKLFSRLKVKTKFYSVQQLTEASQHPSLQQLVLHSPVLQLSLQHPSAQQVFLQQFSVLSAFSIILKLLFLLYTNANC